MDGHDIPRKPNADPAEGKRSRRLNAWMRLRGALKDVYAQLGGGEAYLLQERAEFNQAMEAREQEIGRCLGESRGGS